MAVELAETLRDEIAQVDPDIAHALERLRAHRRVGAGDTSEGSPEREAPVDFSLLLDFEHKGKKLTPHQMQFVIEYVGNRFVPGKDVGRVADYFASPVVLAALRAVTADAIQQNQITATRVVRELIPLISSNISDVMDISAAGITMKDFASLPREVTAAVQEVHEIRNAQGTQLRIKLYDKIAALNTLSKLLGFNKEQSQDISISVDVGDRLSNALQRLKNSRQPDTIEGELVPLSLESPRGA